MCGIFFCLQKRNFYTQQELLNFFNKIQHRGPDHSCSVNFDTPILLKKNNEHNETHVFMGFHRLAITGTSQDANSILSQDGVYLLCNGEIYNYKDLIRKYNLTVRTDSDCEVILQGYRSLSYEEFNNFIEELDGDFAFVLYDDANHELIAARDRMGVRPLFQAMSEGEYIMFASEAKALPAGPELYVFEPGYKSHWFFKLRDYSSDLSWYNFPGPLFHVDYALARKMIKDLLIAAVRKRLSADRPIGFLLSGGLDSSLIAGIAAREWRESGKGKITTFSIGLADSTDLKAAKTVAAALNTDHHEVVVSTQDILDAVKDVIYHNETYDITTTRASIPMYLLSKYISQNTNVKVLFSGEGSDELFGGYLYFHNAPNGLSFQKETHRLLTNLHCYDIVRADRTTAAWGLELRVPFLDADLITFVSGLDPAHKMCGHGKLEKAVLRDAFAGTSVGAGIIPNEILYRQKEAFSDGIGYSSVRALKKLAEEWHAVGEGHSSLIEPQTIECVATPNTLEAKMYYSHWYPHYGESDLLYLTEYWMPKWSTADDPSATVLKMHSEYKNLANK